MELAEFTLIYIGEYLSDLTPPTATTTTKEVNENTVEKEEDAGNRHFLLSLNLLLSITRNTTDDRLKAAQGMNRACN